MPGGVYFINEDGLVEMSETPYDSENRLQELLAKYPNLLAGDQIDGAEPRRWLLVSREVPLSSDEDGSGTWSVDHLFLDQDAIPTIVEVKRGTDTRIRREVVGQMLDYAANSIVHWPIEALRARFEAQYLADNADADDVLAEFLGAQIEVDAFWQSVKTNLQAGKVRLMFVADEIPPRLRRIVEFLNEQMDPAEVLAVEIKQYAGEGMQTLVPRLVGQTAGAQQKKSGSMREGRQWDEASFFEALEQKEGLETVDVAKQILDWGNGGPTQVWWGTGEYDGSFVPFLNHKGTRHQLFAIRTNGSAEIYFQWFAGKPPFDSLGKRKMLLSRLNEIEGVSFTEEVLNRRPSISLADLQDASALRQFLDTYDWVIHEIQAT